ncbi:MAG TPA: amidohydrolase family protein [Kofleriaceae bacterium]|jgi:imidazolonepropionase-like amidohydrolase|nr:amidohydrolase family protein [Kofleriaceae bacterium]
MRALIACSVVIAASCGPAAPARSPAGGGGGERVLHYSIITVGRTAGEAELRIEPDGRRLGHFTFNDRGRGPDIHTELVLDAAGMPRRYRATGHDYLKAPVDERLDDAGGTLRWQSTAEHGQAPSGSGWYVAMSGSGDPAFEQALLRAPGHRLKLLPAGEAWIEDDTTREIEIAGAHRRLHRLAVAGLGFEPYLVWLDEHDDVFASVSSWSSSIQTGAEAAIPQLLADDQAWGINRAKQLAGKLAHRPPGGKLAFVHARLFDSEHRAVVPDATVVIDGDRIAAVGGAATPVPPGAQVIDAHGRTLLPGLWDMHVHLGGGADGMAQLASGITTVRDMGNDMKELAARVARFDAGTELGPRVLRAGLIDGPGPFTAPTGVIASTPEEATAAVARFADAGYVQAKIYSSVAPPLVPVIAQAAHARGMRVSGHIPAHMNAAQAVEAGYDEIQHANFLFLQFLASAEDDTRTPLRFTRVAERGADLDLAGPEVQQFLDLLSRHHTVLDPTLATFHDMFVADPGELDPILVPYASRLPAQSVRFGRGGGLPAPDGKRARFRASFAAMQHMVKLAWDRKIPIVAGTDDIAGLSLPHELELYVQAGIPAPEVLSLATLGAARVMRKDGESGSIAVGKRADLVLVDGDPTHDIAAVRNTDVVVCRGAVYDPGELFVAIGMRPR